MMVKVLILCLVFMWISSSSGSPVHANEHSMKIKTRNTSLQKHVCDLGLGGRCVKKRKPCPEDLPLEKPAGEPYCHKRQRCCYPELDSFISLEEFDLAMADPTLKVPPLEGANAIENSGQFHGDIKLTQQQQLEMDKVDSIRSATVFESRLWKNGQIPYIISSVFTERERLKIARAMAEFEAKTCIRFIPQTTQEDYIHIISGSGCWSKVGRVGGEQKLSLSQKGCVYFGIALHEFMHASGFWHEQSRYDRDNYVIINLENIKPGRKSQFSKRRANITSDLGLQYDYSSLMHYSATAFSINGQATITSKKQGVKLGQRKGLSQLDVRGLQLLYKCDDVCGSLGGVRIGTQCLTFSTEKLSWDDAAVACTNNNGQLASLADNAVDVLAYAVTNYGPDKVFWAGGSDAAVEGSWAWLTGEPFDDQFPWGEGEPDNWYGYEDCLILWFGYYKDQGCFGRYRYICELGGSSQTRNIKTKNKKKNIIQKQRKQQINDNSSSSSNNNRNNNRNSNNKTGVKFSVDASQTRNIKPKKNKKYETQKQQQQQQQRKGNCNTSSININKMNINSSSNNNNNKNSNT